MTVTSIGSSFSYIRPERAAGATAAPEAQETPSRPDADSDGDEATTRKPTASSATGRPVTVSAASDELQAALLRVQEERTAIQADTAARAYGGR